jgi:predicted nucleotidyltransferase
VRVAVLFGSQATGKARSGSDVDLAVQAPGADLVALGQQLSVALGQEVDIVDLDEVGYPLLKRIVREGVRVHEQRPGAFASWRSRAIATLETDRPWFERMRDAYLAKLATGAGGDR